MFSLSAPRLAICAGLCAACLSGTLAAQAVSTFGAPASATGESLQHEQDPSQPAPTNPPPVFRSRVDAIEIELRVVDSRGELVKDLRPDEVAVFEDGRPQRIVAFTRVSVPPDPVVFVDTRPEWFGPPDVVSNRRVESSRIFVLILDDLHVNRRNTAQVKAAARRFVERHVQPGDLVSVVYTGGRPDAAQDFTLDRARMLAAIDKFVGRRLPAATIARMEQYNQLFRARGRPRFEDLRDPHDGERAVNARTAMAAIEGVSRVLARVAGRRKAALLFSEGLDYDLSGLRSRGRVPGAALGPTVLPDTVPTGGSESDAAGRLDVHSYTHDVLLSLQAAIGAAGRGNVTLYAMNVQGGNSSDVVADLGAPVEDPTLGLTVGHVNLEMRDAQETLAVIAENTGGFAALTPADHDAVFSRIVRESSEYYLLAYSPRNSSADGTYRDIEVRVSRPGVRVLARQGYYAPRRPVRAPFRFVAPGISDETSQIVMAPVPASGLGLEAHAVALRRNGSSEKADVIVTTHIDGRELAGPSPALNVSNTLEVALIAVDSGGRIHAANGREVAVRLDAVASDILRNSGYRVISRLQLPPGRYQIRQAVRERSGLRYGSVFAELEVPNFTKGLSMSGILLTSSHVSIVPTSVEEDAYGRLPVLPSVRRAFAADDMLVVMTELYSEPVRGDVDVMTSIRDGEGLERFRHRTTVREVELQSARGTYTHGVRVPLRDLRGDLLLTVDARPAGASAPAVLRRVGFHVAQP